MSAHEHPVPVVDSGMCTSENTLRTVARDETIGPSLSVFGLFVCLFVGIKPGKLCTASC